MSEVKNRETPPPGKRQCVVTERSSNFTEKSSLKFLELERSILQFNMEKSSKALPLVDVLPASQTRLVRYFDAM